MKKAVIGQIDRIQVADEIHRMTKVAVAEGENLVVSDGYHTFDELYDHRITLFIALARTIHDYINGGDPVDDDDESDLAVWRSKLHSDGTSYEGWFILGIGREKGSQITYHLPDARWDECGFAETLEKAPEFDGHTPADVLERLKKL
mgnify:CR=1 FL=1